jgi:ABC-type uncharacterized transport system substrate-binding protein
LAVVKGRAMLGFFLLGLFAGSEPALAHPHVFVNVHAQVLFDSQGKVTAIRQQWTFDDMYTAFAVAGLNGGADKGPSAAQLQAIAKKNIDDLTPYQWFTHASGGKVRFVKPTVYGIDYKPGGKLHLHFTLPLAEPASAGRAFTFEVYDPSYFVAFSLDDKVPPTLEKAPNGCSISVFKPKPLDPALQAKLNEAFFANLSPGANFGVQLAARVFVACP